ncbi:MAG: HupE/UreJ family protein [Myxococcota bacterium]|nr:HupE/UreJ family protein [Myxococcota bacterium]
MKRLIAIASILLAPVTALAHQVGVSLGDYVVRENGLDATLTTSSAESMTGALSVSVDGTACAPGAVRSEAIENDGMRSRLHFACVVAADAPVLVEAAFAPGHRHIATVRRGERETQHVLFEGNDRLTIAPGAASSSSGFDLFMLGIEHILTGFDHLVFLLALVLVDSRLHSLVRIVTAFTVAHSASLALAATGILAPPAALIEPLIAASILYVGVESLVAPGARHRWTRALAFGFVHGFGFAGALLDLALPRAQLPSALFAFNLGVETGQLAVLAILVPLLSLARRRLWVVRTVSAAVVIAGAVWLAERLMLQSPM